MTTNDNESRWGEFTVIHLSHHSFVNCLNRLQVGSSVDKQMFRTRTCKTHCSQLWGTVIKKHPSILRWTCSFLLKQRGRVTFGLKDCMFALYSIWYTKRDPDVKVMLKSHFLRADSWKPIMCAYLCTGLSIIVWTECQIYLVYGISPQCKEIQCVWYTLRDIMGIEIL